MTILICDSGVTLISKTSEYMIDIYIDRDKERNALVLEDDIPVKRMIAHLSTSTFLAA